jgi:phosphoribosylanthranilate isomerase
MSLITTVKIGQISNLSDARYCAGMGVEMLGFAIDETNPDYVSLAQYKQIRSWISGVKIVVETTDVFSEELWSKISSYEPDMIQVANSEAIAALKTKTDLPLILKIEANQDADNIDGLLTKNVDCVQYFLLESANEISFDGDWPYFSNQMGQQYPLLLGFGLTSDNVIGLLKDLPLAGISLKGSQEIRPGFKDFGDLMDILEILEEI